MYYQKLRINRNYEQRTWRAQEKDEGTMKLEELEKFIKNLQKEQAPEEDIKSVLYKYALKQILGPLLSFYSNIYTTRLVPRKLNNNNNTGKRTVHKKT